MGPGYRRQSSYVWQDKPVPQPAENNDRIVYTVVVNSGGVDGRDHTAKGGPKFASFDKQEAASHVTPWDRLESAVIDVKAETEKALAKLTPLERLLLTGNK